MDQQATQAEDQANEITFLRLGFPAVVKQSDDDAVHIQTVMTYINNRSQSGAQPEPAEGQMLEQHIVQHLEALKEKDPKAGRQMEAELKNLFAQLQQAAEQQTQQNVEQTEENVGSVENIAASAPMGQPA